MSFRISLDAYRSQTQLRQVCLTRERPLALEHGHYNGHDGVLALVQHRAESIAYFYPWPVIDEKTVQRGGQEGYVYFEGFDIERKVKNITAEIQTELPGWQPSLEEPVGFGLSDLQISQPGIDMWRLLNFAFDRKEQVFAPGLVLKTSATDPVLIAGNHRALYLFACGLPSLDAAAFYVPSRAINYMAGLRGSLEYVKGAYGSSNVMALAQSFIRQVEEQEK